MRFLSQLILSAILMGGYPMSLSAMPGRSDEPAGSPVIISADDPAIHYSGRIDFSDPKSPSFWWPATSVEAKFHGSSIGTVLGDTNGENVYAVIFDGDTLHAQTLQCAKGEQLYTFGPFPNRDHTVLIFLRSETWQRTWFKGFQVSPGGCLKPVRAPRHKIEFYGGSMVCGRGNEGSTNDHATESNSNAFLSYAPVASRMLDADCRCIARSGLPLTTSWGHDNFNMTSFYDRLDPAVAHSWDFKLWTPDVVVIHLGQNDNTIYKEGVRPDPGPEVDTAAYKSFVSTMRATYPNAWIFCILGPMDAVRSPWKYYEAAAVQQLNDAGDSKVDFLPIDGIGPTLHGVGGHPNVAEDQEIAEVLTSFIQEKTGWK
jgi:hypothetical protein